MTRDLPLSMRTRVFINIREDGPNGCGLREYLQAYRSNREDPGFIIVHKRNRGEGEGFWTWPNSKVATLAVGSNLPLKLSFDETVAHLRQYESDMIRQGHIISLSDPFRRAAAVAVLGLFGERWEPHYSRFAAPPVRPREKPRAQTDTAPAAEL